MTESEKAYAAGFFDGEGAVVIEHSKKQRFRRRPNKRNPQRVYFYQAINWRLRVAVSQIDPSPLLWLQERYGGSIAKRKKGKHGRHDFYSWQLGSLASDKFLRDIQPYCIVKRREIDIAVKFRALIKPSSKPGLTENEMKERLRLAEEIRVRSRWANSPYMATKRVDFNAVVEEGGIQ